MSDCVCGNRMSGTPASRREFLARCGMGFGALGLVNLLAEDILTAGSQARELQFSAKAKHVIHIFAQGAPNSSSSSLAMRSASVSTRRKCPLAASERIFSATCS